jgi:hypothetical protein
VGQGDARGQHQSGVTLIRRPIFHSSPRPRFARSRRPLDGLFNRARQSFRFGMDRQRLKKQRRKIEAWS